MLATQRTALPGADAPTPYTAPRRRQVRRRRLDPRDVELRAHLRAASELYLRAADLDMRDAEQGTGIFPNPVLFRRAFRHLKIGWDTQHYRPDFPTGTTLGEDADVFLRKLADYQRDGHHLGFVVLDPDALDELTRWAHSFLDIRVCELCDEPTLAAVCPRCNNRLPAQNAGRRWDQERVELCEYSAALLLDKRDEPERDETTSQDLDEGAA